MILAAPSASQPTDTAVKAINSLGLDLLRKSSTSDRNFLLSPYSIQSALAMTYAGAKGDTRVEMAKVLYYPDDDTEVHRSFAALRKALGDVIQKTVRDAERMQKSGGKINPITLTMANRLFGRTGYAFRQAFLDLVKDNYGAPFEPLDFVRNAPGATKFINNWVEEQTRQRIRDLIPDGALNDLTRLVLVNAIYLKVPWADEFSVSATKPQTFYLGANNLISTPTMTTKRLLGYAKREGFMVLTIPYRGGDLQFLTRYTSE